MKSTEKEQEKDSGVQFPIVGIGASAGGLEAFKLFIKEIPEKSGMSFVFVQHLSPDHETLLPELLHNLSRIPVREIEDGVSFEPDQLYVIPSNKLITVVDGAVKLQNRDDIGKLTAIDLFFSSLAAMQQSLAIGVILSGTGTDGTLGLKEIKVQGGITFAQDEQSAAFKNMPKNAIDAGVVDFVLPPGKIARQLIEINKPFHKNYPDEDSPENIAEQENEVLREILLLVNLRKRVDFSHYKQTTIKRRIVRRMALQKIEKPLAYLELLKENSNEVNDLFNDLLISVTGFFRDPDTFSILCDTVLPEMIKGKMANQPLRIWVAGCATGEEAYSIAMCVSEILGNKRSSMKIQIFATDISETAIAKARNGVYQQSELTDVSPARLERFFIKLDGSYQINKFIREMCIFAHHNLLTDPPFSSIDLVNCRNVLIYFDPPLQKKALSTFHYSLNDRGVLMLGKSETIGSLTDLFASHGNHEKIYLKKGGKRRFMHVASLQTEQTLKLANQSVQKLSKDGSDVFRKVDEMLLSNYTPPGVLVNEHFDIIQFRGEIDLWLTPPSGRATLNLLKMAREGLGFEIRSLINQARITKTAAKKEQLSVKSKHELHFFSIEAIPVDSGELHFLVLFRETPTPILSGEDTKLPPDGKTQQEILHARIEQLEKELAENRNEIRAIIEDHEAANEELQSANEELLSGSEELQSLNEELETSKEELQSTNEELVSVNHELIDRNDQLNNARKYAEAIVSTIRDPLLILDNQLKIKSATEGFYKKFRTNDMETEGFFFYEIGNGQWDNSDLRNLLENILPEKSSFTDFEITHTFPSIGERTMVLNGRQLTRENTEQLILLSIEDVTDRKRAEEALIALKKSNDLLEHSNQELDQFASIASHDLQEPLRKIMTFVKIIDERKLESIADASEYIHKIYSSASRMDRLIKELLNYSRISGDGELFVLTDLNEIIDDVINDLELPVMQKNAIIHKGDCPVIEAVPLQMNQLFYNLLGNALKFTRPGTVPEINISSRKLLPGEVLSRPNLNVNLDYYEITVSDNGIGFNQEFAEQIFVIFQRLNTEDEYPGTGIGLSLCRKIVLNHSGEISASSVENAGASFRIILPAKQLGA